MVGKCPKCSSEKIRFVMDYQHILLNKPTDSLWVCDNCYYRFKVKYDGLKFKRGSTKLTKEQMDEKIDENA